MIFKRLDVAENSNIGIYLSVGEKQAIIPTIVPKHDEQIISDTLGVECIRHNIADSVLNGVFSKIYNNKILLSKAASQRDIMFFESMGFKIEQLDSYFAIGNLIVTHAKKVVISSIFDKEAQKKIKDFFKVTPKVFSIGELPTIGSCVVVNKKGFAAHPHSTPAELKKLKTIFGVPGNIATVNYGDGFVGNGLIATDNGLLFGSKTTGYELIRIDDIFGT